MESLQISNASVPFPNAVAPFSPKVDQPSSGVTKDILVSSFSPVSESQSLTSSQNSLSEKAVVYSPQTLVQALPNGNSVAPETSQVVPKPESTSGQFTETVSGEPSPESQQGSADVGNTNVQQGGSSSGDDSTGQGSNTIAGNGEGEGAIPPAEDSKAPSSDDESSPQASTSAGLSPDERAVVAELSARDREVRTHEQQHQSVGGQYAGAASFSYQTGPDGVKYAVGGEVSIDISAVPNDPQATIDKMRTVKNAALAPAEPSAQDRSVASSANRMIMQAQADLAAQRAEEFQTIRAETQQRQAESAEAREQQQDEQKSRRSSNSEGVRTYESLIELGQRYENGLTPEINLDEVV